MSISSNIEAITCCPVTMEEFQVPVSLSCMHKIEQTIAKNIFKKDKPECPLCSKKFTSFKEDPFFKDPFFKEGIDKILELNAEICSIRAGGPIGSPPKGKRRSCIPNFDCFRLFEAKKPPTEHIINCPVTKQVYKDPVTLQTCMHKLEHDVAQKIFNSDSKKCPVPECKSKNVEFSRDPQFLTVVETIVDLERTKNNLIKPAEPSFTRKRTSSDASLETPASKKTKTD